MKKFKTILLTLITVFLGGMFLVSVGCSKPKEPEVKREKPVITVSEQTLTGKVGEAVTLPAAQASDTVDGDISASVKMNVFFDRDGKYVFPAENAQNGTAGNVTNSFTPTKVGEYTAIYNVKNSANLSSRKEVKINVSASDKARAAQLVSDPEKWTLDDGSTFDKEGSIRLAEAGNSSAAYNGKKIKNGDLFAFRFSADKPDGVFFYTFNAQMSNSFSADAPSKGEATFPKLLFLRILSNRIEPYFSSLAGDNNFNMTCGSINVSLLDGNDHIIAMRNTLSDDANEVKSEIWIDADTNAAASYVSVVTKSALIAHYGQELFDEQIKDAFDPEKFEGWFNVGAYHTGVGTDTMTIKAFSVNGEAMIEKPDLTVTETPKVSYPLNREITFPAAAAEDGNDYSDITSRIELTVTEPEADGERKEVKLDGYTYTPTAMGRYGLTYSVQDLSGNKAFAYYTFACSKGASTEKPKIEFEGSTEGLTAAAGQAFTLPVVKSVTDSFGDDISALLEVELLGPEAKSLNGKTSNVFYSAGVHTIEYSVTDYNGNTQVETVEVNVTPAYDAVPVKDFVVYGGMKTDGDFVKLTDGSAAFGGQKIYSEKVSLLVKLNFASSFGSGDGMNFIAFNVRGGKNLASVPGSPDCSNFDWPNGLNIEINASDGIKIYGGAHTDELGGYSFPEGTKKFFESEVEISWLITDVYGEDGKYAGTKLELWLNGTKVKLSSSHSSGEDMQLSARAVAVRPAVLQASWLSIYVNGSATDSWLYAATIDGSKPAYLKVTGIDADEGSFGEEYTLPEVTASYGGEDKTSALKKYIWINGETEPNYETAQPFTDDALTLSEDYLKGFKLVYRYEGNTVKVIPVTVNAEVTDVAWSGSTENLKATVGTDFTLPALTSVKIGGTQITAGITVKVVYTDVPGAEQEAAGTFKPLLKRDFSLKYYYGSVFLAQLDVAVSGGTTGNLVGKNGMEIGSEVARYTGQQVYGEKVSASFQLKFDDLGIVDFILRRAGNTSWPEALRIRIAPNEIRVCYEIGGKSFLQCNGSAKYLRGNPASELSRQTIVYCASDVYENGVFKGILVELWLNGEKVVFNGGETDSVTDADKAKGIIPAAALGELTLAAQTEIFAPAYPQISWHTTFVLEKLYIDGTELLPLTVTLEPADRTATVDYGGTYTLPAVTAKYGKEDVTSSVTKYIWINGNEEPDYTTPFTEASLTADIGYIKGFKVIYRYDGETIAAVAVTVNAEITDIAYSGAIENLTAAVGTEFIYPTITSFKMGGTTLSEGITIMACWKGTNIIEQQIEGAFTPRLDKDFTLKYYYGTILLGSTDVAVSGGAAGDVWNDEASVTKGFNGEKVEWIRYDKQYIYDEKVSVKVNVALSGHFDIVMRGPVQSGGWPTALRIRISDNEIKVCSDINAGDKLMCTVAMDTYFPNKATAQDKIISFRAADKYDGEGNFLGIQTEVWIDGVKVVWQAEQGRFSDGLITAVYLSSLTPDVQKLFFTPTALMVVQHINGTFGFSEARIDGTEISAS